MWLLDLVDDISKLLNHVSWALEKETTLWMVGGGVDIWQRNDNTHYNHTGKLPSLSLFTIDLERHYFMVHWFKIKEDCIPITLVN
jgi:hypothetical protein